MSVKFGTSGLRGLATDLIGGVAFTHVQAFARHLLEFNCIEPHAKIYMAQDRRSSSPALAAETALALASCGFEPVDCGAIPTPALALYAMSRGAAAIMITGSHIPADRNGLKFYRPDGEINKVDEAAIIAGAMAVDHVSELGAVPPLETIADESQLALAAYFDRFANLLPRLALAGQKIGVYQHSSVARDFLVQLLGHFGADVVALERSDTFISVDTEALDAQVLLRMAGHASREHLTAIVSTDADADRPLVLDENGAQIRGDVLGIIAAQALKTDFIATPVTSNSAVAHATGAMTQLTVVGSPFVIAAMQDGIAAGYKNVIGFEPNGGFLMASDVEINGSLLPALMTRDSTLPILLALQAGAQNGGLAKYVAALKLPIAMGDRLQNFPLEKSAAFVAKLTGDSNFCSVFTGGIGTVQAMNTTDGLRMTLDSGVILHLRPSGNAPEMRCYVEAPNAEKAHQILNEALKRIIALA